MLSRLMRLLALAMASALVGLSPAHGQWLRAESPHFVVYGQGSEAQLRQRVLLLEDYHQLLRALTGASGEASPNRLPVYIVRGHDQLSTARPVDPVFSGYYFVSATGMAAFSDERSPGNPDEILLHEYAHHFMWQYAAGAYPGWYVEGFADYLATARFERREIQYGWPSPGRASTLLQGSWLPMRTVLTSSPQGLSADDTGRFYAQSWILVHYFFSDSQRLAALRRFLAAYARGEDRLTAFERETGLAPDQLQRELMRYARGRLTYNRRPRASENQQPEVAVVRLPASANDLLLLEAGLRLGADPGGGAGLLQRVRAAAARHPGDAYAKRVLAHAETLYGDGAAADVLLVELLAGAPSDAELLYLHGMRQLAEADQSDDPDPHWRAAREWFTRAHQADPHHVATLYNYALSLRGSRQFLSENTANVLLLAHQLAPQSGEIAFLAAQLLMRLDRHSEAEALLAPLAADVHGGPGAAMAREMLEGLRDRARGSAPPAGDEE